MERYRNLSGGSGVEAYEIGDDFVAVRFRHGVVYWYTEASVGERHVSSLKRLARRGRGLSTYISRHAEVSGGYARKEPDD
ncbi:hypothetical protein BCh11DRAFT_05171 [Burkholderia sp. Ch1-1]|uniref:KTSC domain-containing protein n=1 Tax=Paraburkholderia dioscoreae TaxID=2604047 RepID=A0A5Q4ZPE7_9BURK|nr:MULTISPECIES: hypothetical protein [Paraburkholderia]EIF29714.1 hypothetical protein BCh11DRAFT_05171 [Burkholderia sp. Ch1-1]MDR8396866.1 hypothetical protein [Paraburkholderia sp. USG1]VVD30208.1 conserved protein of unknown function [Paraburkholderia dioscoreae]